MILLITKVWRKYRIHEKYKGKFLITLRIYPRRLVHFSYCVTLPTIERRSLISGRKLSFIQFLAYLKSNIG